MNSKELHPVSTNSVQYFIVVKNCSTIWRVSSFRISIAGVGTRGALFDPVSMIVTEVLSEVEGGALVPPKSIEASWVKSCLISEVTTGASGSGTVIDSCVSTSRTGSTVRAFSVEASTEISFESVSMIGSSV